MKSPARIYAMILGNQQGVAILAALVVMVMLTVLGLAGIYLSTTDIMISHNYRVIKQKFYAAEAALQQGINILRGTSIEDWNDYISTATAKDPEVALPGMSDVEFQGMRYTIKVKNNLDDFVFGDANYTVDEWYSTNLDNIMVVVAEGMGDSGQPKVLEAAVEWEPGSVHSYGGKDITSDNVNVTVANIDWN
ncbi:MAG: PilX N-terminal domain-containing pilus assembly protein [bacterium]